MEKVEIESDSNFMLYALIGFIVAGLLFAGIVWMGKGGNTVNVASNNDIRILSPEITVNNYSTDVSGNGNTVSDSGGGSVDTGAGNTGDVSTGTTSTENVIYSSTGVKLCWNGLNAWSDVACGGN